MKSLMMVMRMVVIYSPPKYDLPPLPWVNISWKWWQCWLRCWWWCWWWRSWWWSTLHQSVTSSFPPWSMSLPLWFQPSPLATPTPDADNPNLTLLVKKWSDMSSPLIYRICLIAFLDVSSTKKWFQISQNLGLPTPPPPRLFRTYS